MARRALWLINHSTLRSFEVPLLRSLGVEVFVSKQYPLQEIGFRSGSADFQYDPSLTIPARDLARLNAHDFYQEPLYPDVRRLINRHFDVAICGFFPAMLQQMADGFDGLLLLRAFGVGTGDSYGDILRRSDLDSLLDRFEALGRRFRFAECYPTIHEIEPAALRRTALELPLGLPDATMAHRDTWVGGSRDVLFFCPSITVAPAYYGRIYQDFKEHFGDLQCIIAGEQRLAVVDSAVRGFRPREEVVEWFRRSAAMFYHSTERRHLHYHPLEAIVYGLPLVYMRQGYLGLLDATQPGACETLRDARRKVDRILAGDQPLIAAIRERQPALLKTFSWEHCRRVWSERFLPLLERVTVEPKAQLRRVAVMLTAPYRGGTLAAAKNVTRMIRRGSDAAGHPVEVVISCCHGHYRINEAFSDVLEPGVMVRETHWESVTRDVVRDVLRLERQTKPLVHYEYIAPRDGTTDFFDCDRWLLIGDRTAQPIAPYRRYGVIPHDFAQRYVPELLGSYRETGSFGTLRSADFLLVTTPSTAEDAVQYAGVARPRVLQVPMEFDPPLLGRPVKPAPTIVWPTNSSAHKNHLVALEALDEFLDTCDTVRNVIVTGIDSRLLSPDVDLPRELAGAEHLLRARAFIQSRPRLARRLDFRGELSRRSYLTAVAQSRFLLHPTRYDNGTYAVLEAAWLGVPSVSSDYPAMRFIGERFGLPLQFFDPDSSTALVAAMQEADSARERLVVRGTERDRLAAASWDRIAGEYWKVLGEAFE